MTTTAAADPTITALVNRMDIAEARLAGLSRAPYPAGRTDPDPGAEETWDAARVWAHIGEFLAIGPLRCNTFWRPPQTSPPLSGD